MININRKGYAKHACPSCFRILIKEEGKTTFRYKCYKCGFATMYVNKTIITVKCKHSNWLYFFGKRTLRLVKWCVDCDEEIRILNAKDSMNCDGVCIQCNLSWSQCMSDFGEQEVKAVVNK